jgi:hypothetical protein
MIATDGRPLLRDADIRGALITRVRHVHRRELDTRVVEELALCQGEARVDVAVVNGKIHGYEIKSERDTLDRLAGQAAVYGTALDRVTLVITGEHATKAVAMVPEWWGVLIAAASRNGVAFTTIRRAKDNPCVDAYAQAQLLWRDEALAALSHLNLATGMKSKPKKLLWLKLFTSVQSGPLRAIVRERLKTRSDWRAGSQQS